MMTTIPEDPLLTALDLIEEGIEQLSIPGMAKRAAAEVIGHVRRDVIASSQRRELVDKRLLDLERELGRTIGRVERLERK